MNLGLVSKKLLNFFKYGIILLVVLPQLTFATTNTTELSAKIEEVRKEREVLLEEQKRLQQELEKINGEALTLGTAVKSLDAVKKKLNGDINITQSKITSTSLAIRKLEGTMGEKEQQIATHRKAIADTLNLLFTRDKEPLVLSILASTRLADIWGDNNHLENLNTKLQDEINNLRETKHILSQEKAQKEKVVEEQASLKAQLNGQKSVVEENKKAKEKLLAQTKSTEAEYQKLIQANIARQRESEADLYRLEQELRIVLDPSLFPDAKHGILFWPVDKVYITGYFGRADCNIYAGSECFHNGLDFRASMNTQVRSMLSGVVEGIGNTDEQKGCYSYGNWILIKHSNGLSSVYAHLSSKLVTKGQNVNSGEVIGYSGGIPGVFGSGYSKGAHLHVGLFASQGVEIRQFTSSIGCKQVFVPIAKGRDAYLDPLLYLPSL